MIVNPFYWSSFPTEQLVKDLDFLYRHAKWAAYDTVFEVLRLRGYFL